MRSKNTLIIFTKAALICRVKTRMWPELNHRQCFTLYRQLQRNTIKNLVNSKKYKIVVYSTQKHVDKNIPGQLIIKQQIGNNLGQRMHNAIKRELKNSQRVVLIGCDCVSFTKKFIENSFKQLASINDIVMTPTYDGGYCLIGMKEPCLDIFSNIAWSSPDVLTQTNQVIKQQAKHLKKTSIMRDIDRSDDLKELNKSGELPSWANCYIN